MAVRFPAAWLDELRARADIVQIISGYVNLKKNGHRHWGLCLLQLQQRGEGDHPRGD